MKVKKFSKDHSSFYLVYDNRWIKEFQSSFDAFDYMNKYNGSLDKSNFRIVPCKGIDLKNMEQFPIDEFLSTVKPVSHSFIPTISLINKKHLAY